MITDFTVLANAIWAVYEDERFWVTILDGSDSGPFDGGCLICAKAIILAAGAGELVRIVRSERPDTAEHYGARVNGVIYDFDGAAMTPEEWIERFAINEGVRDRPMSFGIGLGDKGDTPEDAVIENKVASMLTMAIAARNAQTPRQASATKARSGLRP